MKLKLRTLNLLVIGLLISCLLISGCAGQEKEQTALEAIKAKGVMTVGTSADYPPYEFVDEQGQFAGFDIELIGAIGEKLGVEIKIEDMGFDTLIAALQQGKIDAIIAAMSATPDRLEKVDFTDPYYKSSHAVLAKSDSAITLTNPEEMAGYNIGVQTGTIQDEWVNTNLLETGKIKEDTFHRYQNVAQAVLDLTTGRIDFFVLDYLPAEEYAAKQPVKVIYNGQLSEESAGEAIAIAKGNPELLTAVNDAIKELEAEKVIHDLAVKHLKQSE